MTPAERVDGGMCDRWGEGEVVRRCAALLGLRRRMSHRAVTTLELAMVLGGLTDRGWLAERQAAGQCLLGAGVGGRALRYVWAESAAPAVVARSR